MPPALRYGALSDSAIRPYVSLSHGALYLGKCSLINNFAVSFIIIFGTLSFPV